MTTAGQLRRAGVYVPSHVPDHETVDAVSFTSHGMVRPAVDEIAARVVELLRASDAVAPTSDVLTRSEAKRYVKRSSEMAFCRWCKRWKIKPASRGRYARAALDLALQREGGLAHTPATLRKHQAELGGRAA